MTSDARRLGAILRNDFRAFVHRVFTTLAPGQSYVDNWHLAPIAYRLERVRLGQCAKSLAILPPEGRFRVQTDPL
jgi:hypothetical protein